VTASSTPSTFIAPAPAGPRTAIAISVAVVAGAAVLGLLVAGITFLALAIAFPIAVPIAEQVHVVVPAADMALAERLADFWWVFAGLSVASFVSAGFIVVRTISFLSPVPRD